MKPQELEARERLTDYRRGEMYIHTLDKLYLEIAQLTDARNAREVKAWGDAMEAARELEVLRDPDRIAGHSDAASRIETLLDRIIDTLKVPS